MKKSIIILSTSILSALKPHAQTSNTIYITNNPMDLMVSTTEPSDSLKNKEFLDEKVNIGGVTDGAISKDVILKSKEISLDKKASSIYHISSFQLTLVTKVNGGKEFKNEQNDKLTKEMLDAIKDAPTGSKIFIEHIRGVDKNKLIYKLNAVQFILK